MPGRLVRVTLLGLAGLTLVLWRAPPGWAAGMRIEPVAAKVQARPGERFQFSVRLTNTSPSTRLRVLLELVDVMQPTATQRSFPPAGTTPYSCASWLQLPATQVTLAPRQQKTLIVTGRVPSGARGSRHAAILFTPAPAAEGGASEPGARVSMAIRAAFAVDVIIPGSAPVDVELADLELLPALDVLRATPLSRAERRQQYRDKAAARVTYENKGAAAVWVKGYAYLRDAATGRIVQKQQLGGDDGVRVLPLSEVACHCIFPGRIAGGDYVLELQGQYGDRGRRLQAKRAFQVEGAQEFGAAGALHAQSERHKVTLRPDHVEVPLSPGTSTTRRLLVRNEERIPLRCTAQLQTFTVEPDGTVAEQPPQAASHITVTPAEFQLAPRAATNIRVQVTPGEGLSPTREHYWLVKVTARPAEATAESQAVGLAGALVVAADPRRVRAAVPQLAGAEVQDLLNTTVLKLLIRNAGGREYKVAGMLAVREAQSGLVIGTVSVPQGGEPLTVLAGSARLLTVTIPKAMAGNAWACVLALNTGAGQPATFPFTVKPAQRQQPAKRPSSAGADPEKR